MKTRFNFPTRIIFGQGVIEDLPAELKRLGVTRALMVTDKGLASTQIPSRIKDIVSKENIETAVFDETTPNPTGEQVEAGAEAYKAHKADGIIAVGGGSPMDAGKAIQIRINHHEPLEVYDDLLGGDEKITGALPPLAAIPTTSGTGSEVSRSAVVTVAAVERKVVLFHPDLMPKLALCDPELTYGLPPRITAETGMDALSHNIEAYLSVGYHPMADAIALAGIDLVSRYLETAVHDGKDVSARQEMMAASLMGATAFQKGLGVVHSLAHPLSSVANISHGLANAIMMPHALRFNGKAAAARIGDIAAALGAEELTVEGAIAAVNELMDAINLPKTLREAGVEESHLETLIAKAMDDGCHKCNPRPCSAADMEALFKAAF